jgi:hypothetical protein
MNYFEWTASDKADDDESIRRYGEQSEALALALMVNRQATLSLSVFDEYPSDHERIAACRRAFRSGARHLYQGTKVRTLMVRDGEENPAAVVGYIDSPPTMEELREAMDGFDY